MIQGLFRKSSYQTFKECCFSHSRWANDGHYDRGRIFVRSTINERYMEASLFSFGGPSSLPFCSTSGFWSKCLGTMNIGQLAIRTYEDCHTFSLKPVDIFSLSFFLSAFALDWLGLCGLCLCSSISLETGRVIEKEGKRPRDREVIFYITV